MSSLLPRSLLIKNGTAILRPTSSSALQEAQVDIKIIDGKIHEIGPRLTANGLETLDAKGLHILPGVIDSQVHFREPGMTHKEDIESGSRAALLGGVTAYFEMPNTKPSTTTVELFQDKLKLAQKRSHTHYAFYVGASTENINELPHLETQPHCCGIKVFVGSSTGTLLVEDDVHIEQILRNGRRRVIFHSEDEALLRDRKEIAIKSGRVHDHPVWRSVESCVSSTTRILKLAEKTKRPVHILHVTTAEEMDLLAAAQKKIDVTVEVLPQHLTLFAPDCYDRLGTLAQQNPPIREKRHQERIWKAVQDGTVSIIGSDHAPHTLEEKSKQYPQTPSGVPGVQTLLPIMLDHMNQGRLNIFRLVELMCEAPGRVFGLKNKGEIKVGGDGDLTLVDLKLRKKIENKWIASKSQWTPFDGMTTQGWPLHVVLRGQIALRESQIILPHAGEAVDF